jgi:hypothetical protein
MASLNAAEFNAEVVGEFRSKGGTVNGTLADYAHTRSSHRRSVRRRTRRAVGLLRQR